ATPSSTRPPSASSAWPSRSPRSPGPRRTSTSCTSPAPGSSSPATSSGTDNTLSLPALTLRTMDTPRFLNDHFLIATPSLHDPNVSRGVTLICQHDDDGAMGLMLNRLSDYQMGEVLEQMRIETHLPGLAEAPVLLGGP